MTEPNQRFSGRVFVVTGGTQGVGEAIALRFAREGAAGVTICGRHEARGAAVEAALERAGARALFVKADLADPDACRAVVAACDARFGRVDGLVNAAAESSRGALEDTSVALWDRLFAVNVRAPFVLCQEVVRLLRRDHRAGSVVNVVSMTAHGGQSFLMAYSASKGALATLTRNLGHALRRDRVRVNGILLGWSDTPGEEAIQRATGAPPDWLARAEATQPFGRLVRPEDAAALAAFLTSDEAQMMTGALIDLDQHVSGAYFDG